MSDETQADSGQSESIPGVTPGADQAEQAQPTTDETAPENQTPSNDMPDDDDKPEWDVATHGPVPEDSREQYKIVGE